MSEMTSSSPIFPGFLYFYCHPTEPFKSIPSAGVLSVCCLQAEHDSPGPAHAGLRPVPGVTSAGFHPPSGFPTASPWDGQWRASQDQHRPSSTGSAANNAPDTLHQTAPFHISKYFALFELFGIFLANIFSYTLEPPFFPHKTMSHCIFDTFLLLMLHT